MNMSDWSSLEFMGNQELERAVRTASVRSSAGVKPSQGHRDQSGHGRVKRILGEIGC